MKKFAKNIICFLVVIMLLDICYGFVCNYLIVHSEGGLTEKIYRISSSPDAELVIMGSSRAAHHYNTKVIEDSLGISVYNAGFEGNGIITAYGFLVSILKYHKPKCIIYDLSGYDIQVDDNTKYLNLLKECYSNEQQLIFADIDKLSPYKLLSSFYRYNSNFPRFIRDCYRPNEVFPSGYQPLYGEMKTNAEGRILSKPKLDPKKHEYLNKFISLCKAENIKLLFVVSPSYKNSYGCEFWSSVKELCESEHIQFLNFENMEALSDNHLYFFDSVHMNNAGASAYTDYFIKKVLNN